MVLRTNRCGTYVSHAPLQASFALWCCILTATLSVSSIRMPLACRSVLVRLPVLSEKHRLRALRRRSCHSTWGRRLRRSPTSVFRNWSAGRCPMSREHLLSLSSGVRASCQRAVGWMYLDMWEVLGISEYHLLCGLGMFSYCVGSGFISSGVWYGVSCRWTPGPFVLLVSSYWWDFCHGLPHSRRKPQFHRLWIQQLSGHQYYWSILIWDMSWNAFSPNGRSQQYRPNGVRNVVSSCDFLSRCIAQEPAFASSLQNNLYIAVAVAEWLRAWDILTMFEATVCGRSRVRSPTGAL